MNKIKNLFSTPRKALCTLICALLVVTAAGAITVYAAKAVAEDSSIGGENALNFACADAGIDPASVKNVSTEFDFENGTFIYEVEFISDNTEYDYWILASDGTVLKKEQETIKTETTVSAKTTQEKTATSETEATSAAETVDLSETASETKAASSQISLDEAKSVALSDAGVSSSNATFTKAKLDYDDGIAEYEIEFYTSTHEYEYEINAATGAVISKDVEAIKKKNSSSSSSETKTTSETKAASSQISLDKAKSVALSDAGVSSSNATFTKAKLDYDDGIAEYEIEFYTSTHEYEYEINAATGAVISKDIEAIKKKNSSSSSSETKSSSSSNESSYIGIDKAKSIAVSHAGLSISEVTFSKAKLENDDGQTVYEIEFYDSGKEYEYTIDASSGAILEYDVDWDD